MSLGAAAATATKQARATYFDWEIFE